MDRPDIYSQEQARSFDVQNGWRDGLIAQAEQFQATVGNVYEMYSGFVASQTSPASLNINLGAGQVYSLAAVDATPWGALPSDSAQVMQQGLATAQTIGIVNSLSGSNQQWVLIQVQFSQVDAVRPGDPDGGILPFYNAANPANPFQGPGNDGGILPTVRQGVATVSVLYGNPASSSPVPPSPSGGNAPLYLILLTGGQTTITNGEILQAGPNVYSGYQYAPLLTGLTNSHHGGVPGQAPKINANTEIAGDIPMSILPVTDSTNPGGLIATSFMNGFPGFSFTGNPNTGVLPGRLGDLYFDTASEAYWVYTGGSPAWTEINPPTTFNQVVITSSTVYTPSANTQWVFIEAYGAGGGGNYWSIVGSNNLGGGGGGAGGFSKSIVAASALGASATVVVGSGTGSAGSGGNTTVSNSNFTITCGGGAGGGSGGYPGAGGNCSSSGSVQSVGVQGGFGGYGLATPYGEGGDGGATDRAMAARLGYSGQLYGGGGGGAAPGGFGEGNGGDGAVVITEFIVA